MPRHVLQPLPRAFSRRQDVAGRQSMDDGMWDKLDRVQELGGNGDGHRGCVNALSWSDDGATLLSGSDDKRICIWTADPNSGSSPHPLKLLDVIATGHRANIFSAKYLPNSSAPTIVSCAGDREVRVFDVEKLGRVEYGMRNREELDGDGAGVTVLRCHHDRTKRIATENSPFLFLTVSEDGTVRQHDLRRPHRCRTECPEPLFHAPKGVDLYSLSVSTVTPHIFAVAGRTDCAFVCDRRMPSSHAPTWGPSIKSSGTVHCVRRLGLPEEEWEKVSPRNQRRMYTGERHITCVKMSPHNAEEVICAFAKHSTSIFSIYDSPGSSSMRRSPSPVQRSPPRYNPDTFLRSPRGSPPNMSTQSPAASPPNVPANGAVEGASSIGKRKLSQLSIAPPAAPFRLRFSEPLASAEAGPSRASPPPSPPGRSMVEDLLDQLPDPRTLPDPVDLDDDAEGMGNGDELDPMLADEQLDELLALAESRRGPFAMSDGEGEMDMEMDLDGLEELDEDELDEDELDEDDFDEDEDFDVEEEDEDEDGWLGMADPLSGTGEFGSVDMITPRRSFRGARNVETVKDCNFLGVRSDKVCSGSDDGNFFVWDKDTGRLEGIWEGDGQVVNGTFTTTALRVMEQHPTLPLLSVSGIDHTVKMFAPIGRDKDPSYNRTLQSESIIRANTDRRHVTLDGPGSFGTAALFHLLANRGIPNGIREEDLQQCQTQ